MSDKTTKSTSRWQITVDSIKSQVTLNYKEWLNTFYLHVKTSVYYLLFFWLALATFQLLLYLFGKYGSQSEYTSIMALFSMLTAMTVLTGGVMLIIDIILFNHTTFGITLFTQYKLVVNKDKSSYPLLFLWLRMLVIAPTLRAILLFPTILFGVSAWVEISSLFNPVIHGEFLYWAPMFYRAVIFIILWTYCAIRNASLMEVTFESDNNESE